jgi:hypothetical protein
MAGVPLEECDDDAWLCEASVGNCVGVVEPEVFAAPGV